MDSTKKEFKNIHQKLLYIQANLKAPKNQYNRYGKYAYRSCEDIQDAVKPLLNEVGCTLVLYDTIENIGENYYLVSTAVLTDCDSLEILKNSALAREDGVLKGMSSAQITGSTSSYARKYALNGLFCISDEKDSDTDANQREKESKNKEALEEALKEERQKNEPVTKKQISDLRKLFKENGIDEAKVLLVYKVDTIEHMTHKMYLNVMEHKESVKSTCSI